MVIIMDLHAPFDCQAVDIDQHDHCDRHNGHADRDNRDDLYAPFDCQAVDTGLQWKSIKGKGEIESCLAGQCLCQVRWW